MTFNATLQYLRQRKHSIWIKRTDNDLVKINSFLAIDGSPAYRNAMSENGFILIVEVNGYELISPIQFGILDIYYEYVDRPHVCYICDDVMTTSDIICKKCL